MTDQNLKNDANLTTNHQSDEATAEKSRSYVADDGTNRYVVEVVADSVEFPLAKSKTEIQGFSQSTAIPSANSQPVDISQLTVDDDLPF